MNPDINDLLLTPDTQNIEGDSEANLPISEAIVDVLSEVVEDDGFGLEEEDAIGLQDARDELEDCFALDLEAEMLVSEEFALYLEEILLDEVEHQLPYPEYSDRPGEFLKEILGISLLTQEQEEICLSVRDNPVTNVQAGAGVGKCLAASEWLILANGDRVQARDLVGKAFELLTLVDGLQQPVKAIADWNAIEPVYIITTESGRQAKRNAFHPFYGLFGWVQVKDLHVGDAIAVTTWLDTQNRVIGSPYSGVLPEDWRSVDCPGEGTVWERIISIKPAGVEQTVAIAVPGHETYLTPFGYEHNSFIASALLLWFIFSVGGKVVTTAPSSAQVDEILWSEVRELYDRNKDKLGGRRGRLFVRLTETARGVGLTATDYDSNAFQGKHSDKQLIVLDESCGISRAIDDGAVASSVGANNRLLRIGNPIADGNPFSEACAKSAIIIKAWSHPNIAWAYELSPEGIHKLKPEVAALILKPDSDPTRKENPVLPQDQWTDSPLIQRDRIPGAISIAWLEMMREQKGETSAFWQSRIEALFPEDVESSIVPRSWFYAAVARYEQNPTYWEMLADEFDYHRHGLDVGDGGDPHAWAMWRGPVLYDVSEKQTLGDRLDVKRAATWGLSKLKVHPGSIAVDRTGVGAGTLSDLLDDLDSNSALSQISWAYGFAFGAKSNNPDLMYLKTEGYWNLREGFRQSQVAIAIKDPKVREKLAEELARQYFEETPNGKTKVEDKKKTVARLKRSPNLADAAMMAFRDQDGGGFSEELYLPVGVVMRR